MTIEWVTSPSIGTYTELDDIVPVTLLAEEDIVTGTIAYVFVGTVPDFLQIDGDILSGTIGELDDWYPGYAQPEDFSYNTDESFGGNYATFGSAYYGTNIITFTIRAYIIGNPLVYADQVFGITIENNYSSDRDRCILQQFEGKDLFIDGNKVTAEEFLEYQKLNGYYV